jgi:hypothetical protein
VFAVFIMSPGSKGSGPAAAQIDPRRHQYTG